MNVCRVRKSSHLSSRSQGATRGVVRFILRLFALSCCFTAIDPVPVAAQSVIPQTNWTVHFVSSQETSGCSCTAPNAFDGQAATQWNASWSGTPALPPHELQINLGATYSVSGFRYLPKQNGEIGRIAQYEFYVSADGVTWGTAVASGTFPNSATEQQVTFTPKTGRYVRLRALSEVNGNPYAVVAELNVLGAASGNQAPNGTITLPTGDVTIAPGQSVTFNGSGSDPENNTPFTYLWTFGTGGPADSTAQNPGSVMFPNAGVYTVNFTVTDSLGLADPTPATRTITVQSASQPGIPQTNWTVHFVSSQETTGCSCAAPNAFDGQAATQWNASWSGTPALPPHELQINLGATYTVNGFRYLPKQNGDIGRIAQYEFYVSADGVTWGTAVASGTFLNTATEQQVMFTPKTGRYVRLRALSEVNGNPYAVVAELNVLGTASSNQPPNSTITLPTGDVTIAPGQSVTFNGSGTDPDNNTPFTYLWTFGTGGPANSTAQNPGSVMFPNAGVYTVNFTVTDSLGLADPTPATRTITVQSAGPPPISQANWTVHFVSSQETTGCSCAAPNAFDGQAATQWNARWSGTPAQPPHELQINLGATYSVSGFRYLPKQNGDIGRIAQYEFYVSADGVTWGTAVASGTFPNTATEQQVTFTAKTGRYVRLRALSEVNGNPYAVVAELNVLGTASSNQPPNSTITLPTGDVTIAVGQSVTFNGSGTDPENNTPFTYLWTFGTGGPANSTVQNPGSVMFPNAGVYIVNFQVTDSLGLADPTPATRTITVGGGSSTPITLIPQTNWTLRFVDSEETFSWDGAGTNAFDNNPNTSWVTQFTDGGPSLPHEIQIDLGAVENVTGFRYLPNQAFQAGRVGAYEFYVSTDGFVWGNPVAMGAFPDTNSGAARDVTFAPMSGRYVAFRALSEVNNGEYTFTALGELNVYRAGTGPNEAPTVSVTSPAADLTIVVGSAIRLAGTASDPDGNLPLTYQWRVGPNAGIADLQGPLPGFVQFDRTGNFTVTLTVADALGKQTAVSRSVTVLGPGSCPIPSVTLSQPLSLRLQTSTTLAASAAACASGGEGVRFIIDGGPGSGGTQADDYSAPYSVTVTGLTQREHLVEARLIDGAGNAVTGDATYDLATPVGIGDYYVAMGDGMTTGYGDNKPDDDNSADGRNMWGGFTPVLANLLTTARGYPVGVFNEGVGGTASINGAATIQALLQKHPQAQYFMVMYGHNDAEDGVPSGLGLSQGQIGYAGSFKERIQNIITAIRAAGKTPLLAKAPAIMPFDGPWDSAVQQYNAVMVELAAIPANGVPVAPPDFYTYFRNHPGEYAGDILMNGIGYQSMAQIWRTSLVP